MTEQELIDLRDSLSTLSDSLTDLLNRVIALEETMPVKHTYLNQILEVFTDHCGCSSTTATPAPTVVITEDVNNDGTISNTELDGKVDVTITVPTEANVGDTLNVKNPDGTTTTVTITDEIKNSGYTTSYDKPADGSTITVSATITDTAGNTSAEGKDSAIIGDTTATPAPDPDPDPDPDPTPTPCDCENGTTTVYLRSSSDGEDSGEITVNTVAYSTIFDVPNNIMTVVRQRLYYNYDSDDYAIIFTNTSSESLCVSISGYSLVNYISESDPIHVDNTNPTVSVDTLADTVSFCLST